MILIVPSTFEKAIESIQSRRQRLPAVPTIILLARDLSVVDQCQNAISTNSLGNSDSSEAYVLVWKPEIVGVGLSFSSRLSALENFRGQLAVSNAMASTLGGGAFMCRHIGLAVKAATSQILIANQLGNKRLYSRAKLHLAYIAIVTGEWLVAQKILTELFIMSTALEDLELQGMLAAAVRHYCSTFSLASRHLLDRPSTDFLSSVTLPAIETISSQGLSSEAIFQLYKNDRNFDELSRIRLTSISATEKTQLLLSSSLLQPFFQ
jgi:hypothetical protein